MNDRKKFKIEFPEWNGKEKEEFLQMIENTQDIKIESRIEIVENEAGTSAAITAINVTASLITIGAILYKLFQKRKKENKPLKPAVVNNIFILGNDNQIDIENKIKN